MSLLSVSSHPPRRRCSWRLESAFRIDHDETLYTRLTIVSLSSCVFLWCRYCNKSARKFSIFERNLKYPIWIALVSLLALKYIISTFHDRNKLFRIVELNSVQRIVNNWEALKHVTYCNNQKWCWNSNCCDKICLCHENNVKIWRNS